MFPYSYPDFFPEISWIVLGKFRFFCPETLSYRFFLDFPTCSYLFSLFSFDFAGLGLDFPGQTEKTPDPGQNFGVSYHKIECN